MNRVMQWDGIAVPFPTALSWSYNEISSDKSGRNLAGKASKKVIATKRKLICSWKCLSDADASRLLSTIKVKVFGSLKYPDAFTGTDQIKKFYTGDATATAVTQNKDVFVWDINFDFIEQ